MTTQTTIEPVRKAVTVNCTVDEAFETFTERLGSWWPLDTHRISSETPETAFFEGRVGGRVYERTRDSVEEQWGEVLAWEPPNRLVFAWWITEPGTEVEVRFTPDGARTRVELEHRGWERLSERAEERRASYDGGWSYVLGKFADAAGR